MSHRLHSNIIKTHIAHSVHYIINYIKCMLFEWTLHEGTSLSQDDDNITKKFINFLQKCYVMYRGVTNCYK